MSFFALYLYVIFTTMNPFLMALEGYRHIVMKKLKNLVNVLEFCSRNPVAILLTVGKGIGTLLLSLVSCRSTGMS